MKQANMDQLQLRLQTNQQPLPGNIVLPLTPGMDATAYIRILESLTDSHFELSVDVFEANAGEVFRWVHPDGSIYLLGLGNEPTNAGIYKVFRTFTFGLRKQPVTELGVVLIPELSKSTLHPIARCLEYMVNGIVTGTNTLNVSADPTDKHPLKSVSVIMESDLHTNESVLGLMQRVQRAQIIGEAQLHAMHLINIPSNWKNPLQFTDTVVDSARAFGFHCEIFDEHRLKEERFDALLAVNRGSEHPARFLVLQYDGTTETVSENNPLIALIGKGVTYDTGGLSMKPSESMVHMKCDMAGAAIVLAVTEAVARLGFPIRLITAIPLTDNLVDARSIKPGDIIGSYAGKSIEVIDTDAEGRLILADAISWVVKNTSPDCMIDIATLTGAAVRTFGSHAAAVFCNNTSVEKRLIESANQSGERIWPLPLWNEYSDDIKSDIADVKNFSGKPTAGSISAAKFLEYFTDGHEAWAHLDVAGTVFGDTEFGKQKNATGYGVRLLVDFIGKLAGETN